MINNLLNFKETLLLKYACTIGTMFDIQTLDKINPLNYKITNKNFKCFATEGQPHQCGLELLPSAFWKCASKPYEIRGKLPSILCAKKVVSVFLFRGGVHDQNKSLSLW